MCFFLFQVKIFKKNRKSESIMSDGEENIRLLPDVIEAKLEDENLDIQKLDIVLRKNIITCIILGIRKSVTNKKNYGFDFSD
jgi:hypothetical protein